MNIERQERFLGYVDILGYKSLTRSVEDGGNYTLDELAEIVKMLGTESDRERFETHGPAICPMASRIQNNLDFQLTQAWDSVVVSAERSPAGAINVVHHCFVACARLLTRGVMCRGYINHGNIYHKDNLVLGAAHIDAVESEKHVSFYRQPDQEPGTPFVEISPDVVDYINNQPDACVKKMLSRMVMTHDGLWAIFPFQRLSAVGSTSDIEKMRENNINIRSQICELQKIVSKLVEGSDNKTLQKSLCYLRALDEQLQICDRAEKKMERLSQPAGVRMSRERFPGLFMD